MSGTSTVVKSADMPDEMKETAQSVCEEAVKGADREKEIAGFVKKKFDDKYGPTWHCVVGRNFGSFITHEQGRFVYLYVGKFAVLLFKSA